MSSTGEAWAGACGVAVCGRGLGGVGDALPLVHEGVYCTERTLALLVRSAMWNGVKCWGSCLLHDTHHPLPDSHMGPHWPHLAITGPLSVFFQGGLRGNKSFATQWSRTELGRFIIPFRTVLKNTQRAKTKLLFLTPLHGWLLEAATTPRKLAQSLWNSYTHMTMRVISLQKQSWLVGSTFTY